MGSIRPTSESVLMPAFVKTSITSSENTIPSASPTYEETITLRPLRLTANGFNFAAKLARDGSSIFRGANCFWSSTRSNFSASAVALACPAFWSAPAALARSASASVFSDWVEFSNTVDRSLAALAFASRIAMSWPLSVLRSAAISPALTSTVNSPASPRQTSATPKISIISHFREGLSGGRIFPRRQSCISPLYSWKMIANSKITPTTTAIEATYNQGSRESNRALREAILANRDSSSIEGNFRRREMLVVEVQLIAIAFICLGAIAYACLARW